MTLSFEQLFDSAPCGYLVTDRDGVIERANETFLDWTGYGQPDVVGSTFRELLVVASQLFYETRYAPVLALNGEVREVSLSIRKADGTSLAVLVNSVMDAAGVRIAVFDSTQRQDYERELLSARRAAEASESSVRVLQDASSAFGAVTTQAALAEALVASALDAFAATAASVSLLDAHGELHQQAGTGPVPDVSSDPLRDAVSSGTIVTVLASDVPAQYAGLGAALDSARLEMMTVVPLRGDGNVDGTLTLYFARRREFVQRTVDFQLALARIAAQVLVRLRLQAELERLALYDQLTGLANRKVLEERLVEVLAASSRHGHPTALLFLDLDGFKAVNDGLGHAVGDAVLVEVAARLRRVVRAGDVIGRFGGDEFIVICEQADQVAAAAVGERIRSALEVPIDGVPEELSVTASVGVAVRAAGGISADAMFTAADSAMYSAKDAGKNRLVVVDL